MVHVQWHDSFIQLRHLLFLLLPLVISVFPYLGLHRLPILGAFVPVPPHAQIPPSRTRLPGQIVSIPPNVTLSQMASMTGQTLNHLVPTLHLLKYTHAAIMRSQETASNEDVNAEDAVLNTENGQLDSSGESTSTTRPATPFAQASTTSSPSASISEPSYFARASKWWAEEAREGYVIRNDPHLRDLLKRNGLSLDEASQEDDNQVPEGQLLTSARVAVRMLKEQGARPSEHWTH